MAKNYKIDKSGFKITNTYNMHEMHVYTTSGKCVQIAREEVGNKNSGWRSDRATADYKSDGGETHSGIHQSTGRMCWFVWHTTHAQGFAYDNKKYDIEVGGDGPTVRDLECNDPCDGNYPEHIHPN